MTDVNKEEAMKKNFCGTAIAEYNLDEASDEELECALDWLLNKDLETVDESELVQILNSIVVEHFPKKNKRTLKSLEKGFLISKQS